MEDLGMKPTTVLFCGPLRRATEQVVMGTGTALAAMTVTAGANLALSAGVNRFRLFKATLPSLLSEIVTNLPAPPADADVSFIA